MTVVYEWDVELVATSAHADATGRDFAAGDIMGHFHQESYKDCREFTAANPAAENSHYEVCLVRDSENPRNGDQVRAWAYIADGVLDDSFYDAMCSRVCKTPKRFFEEMKRHG
ncbi:hypothetical protein D9M71_561890 [compost metagenome]